MRLSLIVLFPAVLPSVLRVAASRSAALLAALLLALPAHPAATERVSVTVSDADWGNARTDEVQQVLAAAAAELMALFPSREPLRIRVSPTTSSPMVLFQRTREGAHQILLRARDRLWEDYVYEFAHELGHVLTNYGRHAREPGLLRHQWFEEAVCDMIALHALRTVARRAEAGQLNSPLLAARAVEMHAFAGTLLRAPHRSSLHVADMSAWLRMHETTLRTNPYMRIRNEEIAARLLEIFERDPAGFVAVLGLNASTGPAPASFREYLTEWWLHTPPAGRPVVGEIMTAFGFPQGIQRH